MFGNILISVLLIAAVVYAVFAWFRKTNDDDDKDYFDESEEMSLNYLTKEVVKEFSRIMRQNLAEDNLSRKEMERKQRSISELRSSIDEAAVGNRNAKKVVKNNIADILRSAKYDLDEKKVDTYVFPFKNPEKMKPMDKFQLILYCYQRKYDSKSLEVLINQYALTDPIYKEIPLSNGGTKTVKRYGITKAKISEIYDQLKDDEIMRMDFNDKIDFISQKIFEKNFGLGAIDMLIETSVDEIDCGVSGIPYGGFAISSQQKNLPYSYESIWITFHGFKMPIECLSFESQDEFVRVSDNVYKYDAPEALSKTNGYVLSNSMDGSRIVVMRPDFADSYAFCLRKFDSSPGSTIEEWVTDENADVPITFLKWAIKGHFTTGITGQQGTGKTTLLKTLVDFMDPRHALRVQELKFELNLRFAYPFRNILTFQETPHITSQEGLNIQKKTNGDINIIGEVANAIQASYVVQTSMVASLYTLFTHHANTAKALVNAFANNLLEIGLYKEKRDAVTMAAQVLNIDCHLTVANKHRYIERITEIIPVNNREYPSDTMNQEATLNDKVNADTLEYYKRQTDPQLFDTLDWVKWENGKYVVVNMPSEAWMQRMRRTLSPEDLDEFEKDMERMQAYIVA